MNILNNLFIIATALLVVLSFGLGFFSLWRNPKSKVVRLWFLMSMAIGTWATGYLLGITAKDEATGFNMIKLVYFGISFVPILFFHFITTFLFKDQKLFLPIIIGYLLSLLFSFLSVFSTVIIKGVSYLPQFGYFEKVNFPGFIFFLIYFFCYVFWTITLLFKGYFENDGIRRKQIFYLILASLIGFFGGITNFLMDLTGVYAYGQLIIWLYPIIITYGIFTPLQIKITRG